MIEMNVVDLTCNADCINRYDGRCCRKFITLSPAGSCVYRHSKENSNDKRIEAEPVKIACDKMIAAIDSACDACKDQMKCNGCKVCEISAELGNVTGMVNAVLGDDVII